MPVGETFLENHSFCNGLFVFRRTFDRHVHGNTEPHSGCSMIHNCCFPAGETIRGWVAQICLHAAVSFSMSMWLWVKHGYPTWNPGKWNQRLKPAVPRWLNFDPHPCVLRGEMVIRMNSLFSFGSPVDPTQCLECQLQSLLRTPNVC